MQLEQLVQQVERRALLRVERRAGPPAGGPALTASSALLACLAQEKVGLQFADLILPTLDVAKQCVISGDEASVTHILEVFMDLSNSNLPLVTPYLVQILDFMMN